MMITFVQGNILESCSEAIVNPVNCEGYRGKGLAYQVKLHISTNDIEIIKLINLFNQ